MVGMLGLGVTKWGTPWAINSCGLSGDPQPKPFPMWCVPLHITLATDLDLALQTPTCAKTPKKHRLDQAG